MTSVAVVGLRYAGLPLVRPRAGMGDLVARPVWAGSIFAIGIASVLLFSFLHARRPAPAVQPLRPQR